MFFNLYSICHHTCLDNIIFSVICWVLCLLRTRCTRELHKRSLVILKGARPFKVAWYLSLGQVTCYQQYPTHGYNVKGEGRSELRQAEYSEFWYAGDDPAMMVSDFYGKLIFFFLLPKQATYHIWKWIRVAAISHMYATQNFKKGKYTFYFSWTCFEFLLCTALEPRRGEALLR